MPPATQAAERAPNTAIWDFVDSPREFRLAAARPLQVFALPLRQTKSFLDALNQIPWRADCKGKF